jgi:8-oxo-dGTP diphosphatase
MYIVNVDAAIHHEGKWLIIERSTKEEHAGGLLSLVGGTVEEQDGTMDILEDTVKREVYEEVGVVVHEDMQYVHSSSFVADKGERVLNIVFLCEYKEGEAYVKAKDEVERVRWMTIDEILVHSKAPVWLIDSIKRVYACMDKQLK